MTDATLHSPVAPRADEAVRPERPQPKANWPLIGDILTARLDTPDLLRLWPDADDRDV